MLKRYIIPYLVFAFSRISNNGWRTLYLFAHPHQTETHSFLCSLTQSEEKNSCFETYLRSLQGLQTAPSPCLWYLSVPLQPQCCAPLMIQIHFSFVTVKVHIWMIDSSQCMTLKMHKRQLLMMCGMVLRDFWKWELKIWMSGRVEVSLTLTGLLNVSRLRAPLQSVFCCRPHLLFYVASFLSLSVNTIFTQPEVHVCLYVW